jgi:hypothetical protein
MQNKTSPTWVPSQTLIIRVLVILVVILALTTGYLATLEKTVATNNIRILKYLDVNTTKEVLDTKWEKK